MNAEMAAFRDCDAAIQRRSEPPLLHVEAVHASYGKREVLRGVSLDVARGEIVALIGPNGAGKSTLLKVVAGLLSPEAGRILLEGRDVSCVPVHQRARAGIGYVIQGGAVFPSLSAEDHLRVGALIAAAGGRESSMAPEETALDPAIVARRDPAGLFSGGQRQALAVAAVLATHPVLLLCDEPSAGLAPPLARQIIEGIARVSRKRGLSVLWVEQRVGEVLPLADRAALLHDGQILAQSETPSEWLAGDTLAEITFGASRHG